jgi:hypothetical protein
MKFVELTSGSIEYEFTGTNELRAVIESEITQLEKRNTNDLEQTSLRLANYESLLSVVDAEWESIVREQNKIRSNYLRARSSGLGFGVQSVQFTYDLLDRKKLFSIPSYANLSDVDLGIQIETANDRIIQIRREIQRELLEVKNVTNGHPNTIQDLTEKLDVHWKNICTNLVIEGETVSLSEKPDWSLAETALGLTHSIRFIDSSEDAVNQSERHLNEMQSLQADLDRQYAKLIMDNLPKFQGRIETLQLEYQKRAELITVKSLRKLDKKRHQNALLRSRIVNKRRQDNNKQQQNHPIEPVVTTPVD